ncbi:hypothetical protein BSQ44_26105 (plasmid) [Aquibium oceanicum]|uniref:Transcription regulator MerR DNA binding domain-containing protein n=1 Tax=Aquibium oceanicum TaxID=1670800 RepID=A0A1L3T010_9HYPH|nr:hypothetical protein BSQ44_26105 [Aquibium oceanicum]
MGLCPSATQGRGLRTAVTVERKIADVKALQDELDRLISQCRCGTVAECRIIETLSPLVPQESKRATR